MSCITVCRFLIWLVTNCPMTREFLLAALLHDIGKGIDPQDHVQAGLEALEGFITPRTVWLIDHHMLAHSVVDGTIGARAHRRLRESESYEELMLLCQCDQNGRQVGVPTPEVDEALDYLRDLSRMCAEADPAACWPPTLSVDQFILDRADDLVGDIRFCPRERLKHMSLVVQNLDIGFCGVHGIRSVGDDQIAALFFRACVWLGIG